MGGDFFQGKKNEARFDVAPWQAQHLTNLTNAGEDFYQKYGSPTQQERAAIDRGQQFYGPGGQGDSAAKYVTDTSKQMGKMGMEGVSNFMSPSYTPPKAQLDMQALGMAYQNPFAQEEIDSYSRDVSRALAENVLPQLRLGSAARGGTGGSRQGIAEGVAGGKAIQDISSNAAKLRSEQYKMGYNTASEYGKTNAENQFKTDQMRATMSQDLLNNSISGMQAGYGLGESNVKGGMEMSMMDRNLAENASNQYQKLVGDPNVQYVAESRDKSAFSTIMETASTGLSMASGIGALGGVGKAAAGLGGGLIGDGGGSGPVSPGLNPANFNMGTQTQFAQPTAPQFGSQQGYASYVPYQGQNSLGSMPKLTMPSMFGS